MSANRPFRCKGIRKIRTCTMNTAERFLRQHQQVTRRHFLRLGTAGAAAAGAGVLAADHDPLPPELAGAIETLEPYFTPQEKFCDVSRGKPLPHSLSEEKKRQAGITRETWKLEVVSDPDQPARIRNPLTKKDKTALDFSGLMKLAEKRAVRFAKTMTCLNIGCPLGTGIWEGVPLRDVIWLTEPRENLRRVFYHGYHNDDPQQLFRSSLPIDRVLEDPFDLPPVILCYKLKANGLTASAAAPSGWSFRRPTVSNRSSGSHTWCSPISITPTTLTPRATMMSIVGSRLLPRRYPSRTSSNRARHFLSPATLRSDLPGCRRSKSPLSPVLWNVLDSMETWTFDNPA